MPMADFSSPLEFLLSLLLPPVRTIGNQVDGLLAGLITVAVLGGTVCVFGWLIRTGRIPAGSGISFRFPSL